ncbi:hypothetical protein Agub_g9714 [Astrephomene gubernaculifera]|uniref:Centrosomal protein of 131 kDa n=1 Tax=Astrephomene gubernaculifera TaxID=47775 RepID=A0AAD3HNH1_9CHLO|nr:hypothetical protein Agub_g9714 [Astrephomene gubernaculifera]
MSGKQQENGGSKLGAPKLPHFPPRKSITTSVPMSPSRRNRVDPLPGVPASPSGPGRLDSARRGRTGADKLASVGRQYEQLNAKDTSGDVDGFDSPKQAQTRAQIARDEVRSYMQQRRQQQQSRHGYNQAPVEPHAASLDDPDDAAGDKHREVRREVSQHDPQQAASGAAGWPQFLAQQWGSRGSPLRHAAAPGLADDDVAASSADQSPTRHKQTCETPAAAAPGHRLTRMAAANARDAVVAACRSTGDAAAIPSARGSSGGLSSDGVTAVAASGGSLTEEAYNLFKREVAARVIQAHWRRWQSWKAKLRREAEERILRQLLEDDSGLSLKLLLGNSGAAGSSSSALDDTDQGNQVDLATLPAVAAATEAGRHREGEGVARPVASSAQRQNPVPQCARGNDAPAAASSRAGKARPASAVGPPASPGVVIPARPRTGGPVASSQTRVQREPQRTSDRKGRSHAGYEDSCEDVGDFLDDGELRGQEADRDLHKQHVQPQKKHAGGHAVYTFVVTPPPREATAAETEEELATSDGGGAQGAPMAATSRTVIPSLPQQHVAPVAAPDAQPEAATLDAASSDRSSRRTSGAGEAQVPGSRRQTLSQQPSLDADANPAMASPALSAITGNGGDAVERGGPGNAPAAQSPLEADSRPRPEPSRRGDLEAAMRTAMEDNPAQNDGQRQRRLPEQGSLDRPQQQQRQEKRPAEQGVVPQQQASNSGQEQRVQPQLRNTDDTQGAAASATQCRPSSQPQLMPPSPQRQARMEALQRLKLQGSQRAGSSSADGSSRSVLNDVRLAADSAEGAAVGRRRGGSDAGQGREQQVRDLEQVQQQHRRQQRPEELMPRQEGRDRNDSRPASQQQLDQQRGDDRAGSDRTRLKPSGLEQPTNHQPSAQPLRPRDQREELPQQDAPRYREERLDREEREPLHAAMRAPEEARRQPHRPSAEPPSPLQRERQERFRRLMSSSEQDLRPQPSAPPPASREANEHDAAAQQRGDARPQRLPETRQQLEGYDPRRHPSRGGSDAGAAASGNESCGESDSGVAVGAPPCRVQGDHATAPRHSRPCSAAAAIGAAAESNAAVPLQRSYSVQQPRDDADDSRRHCPTDQALQPDPQRRRTTAAWPDTSAGGASQQPLEQHRREQEPAPVGSTRRTAGGGAADRRDGALLDPTPALTPPAGFRPDPDPDAGRRRGEGSSQLVTKGHAAPAQGAPPAPSYQAGGKATMSVIPVDDSLTAEKMTSILKYLDEVEMQAEQEATCAAVAPALLMRETSTAAALAAALLPGTSSGVGHAHSRSHSPGSAGGGRRPATASSGRRVTSTSRPGTAATGSLHPGLQKSVAALSEAAAVGRSRPRSGHRRACSPSLADGAESGLDNDRDEDGDFDDDGAASVGGFSAASGLNGRPAFLAESVYESVRVKIRRLQDEVRQRDARVSELTQEVESLQAAQRTCLLEADARLSELLAAQRAEYEAAVSRHLAFVDRLLADKEALAGRAEQLAEQLKGAEERQERAIGKLKEGWAVELRRQKEAWAAAEKQRREAWMASKAAEIKDVTVKGLEGEVQKLLARHKAELAAAQQAAADEARRHLDSYVAQNEVAVRQLKERMARELEEAVEKERSAAATRLREVSERYEQQLQTQRMRLVADADLRLEQLEQARKEDKKRYEEAVATAKEAGETRQREAEEDWKREKEALRKAHDKQIESLREQYETGQEGWRAAMAERARKEVTERVAAIREKLLQERNEEVQAVMTRLEAEHASAAEALKEDFRKREEAAAAKAAAALKEARRAEAKMAERFRTAGVASQAAEERLAASELTVQELRRELESRSNTIRWLESQVSAAKEEAAARERDVRSLGAEKAAVAAEATAAVTREKELVEARLAQALQETQDQRSRHSAEMAAVETRVRAALARKDEVIAGLREQLSALAAELQGTQEVLRQQQEELGSVLDGGEDDDEGDVRSRRGGRY